LSRNEGEGTSADFASVILQGEAERQEAGSTATDDLPMSALPGVGGKEMTLRQGLAKGGSYTFVVLLLLSSLDELESSAFNVLGPNIRAAFGVSDGTIVFLGTASVAFFVLGAVPFGWLADRRRRAPLVGWSTIAFGGFVFLTGLTVNAFSMFWTRLGSGVAKANTLTVHPSLLADTYPVAIRGRLFSTTSLVGRILGLASPILAGVIADRAGAQGWRWAFFVLGLPAAAFAVLSFRVPEPRRGQWEQQDVLGELLTADDSAPSMEAGFTRLWKIKTLKTIIVALAAMGFFLFSGQSILFLYLEERFKLSATNRGWVGTVMGLGAVFAVPFVGRYFDRSFRKDPAKSLAMMGWLNLPAAAIVPLQYLMPNLKAFVALAMISTALTASAFSVVNAAIQAVIPFRLRGLGSSLATMYIFLIGGVGGGLVGSLFTNAFGPRAAIIIISVPSLTVGSVLVIRSARSILSDMALNVGELHEEMEEQTRRNADPETVPVVQVNQVNFSYGQVQVLFDLGFEVRRGETLALLGTNGAGKSTILRIIAGLEIPERGVVRLNGRTVTFSTPAERAAIGIQLLPGGAGVFPSMSVRDNLLVGAYQYRHDRADVDRRVAHVFSLFPELARREDAIAGSMSGGQQQMLAFARVMLHEPQVLLIDELSLGLAPTVVQQLLEIVDMLKASGQAMIIVEQSLNIALAVADRAVFLEKGRVRFDGDARELAERGDLARAVFLGAEGG
jgi:ABC-type branched-subunit amino acid transport system ATPase component/predicted MFS family arabinose efflux permease